MSSSQPPRWRRGLASLTAAAVALLGGVAGVATPANAAPASSVVSSAPVASAAQFAGSVTYTPSAYAEGKTFTVEAAGTGFLKDTFPNPIKSDGTEGTPMGIYIGAFKPGTDLSKVTMENMGDYTLGAADWIMPNQITADGTFTRTIKDIPAEYAGQKIQIVTWVAHGNIDPRAILTNDEVQLEAAPAPKFEPSTAATITSASQADGLAVKVDGSNYVNFPKLANGKDAAGVYAAIIDRDLATGDTDITAKQMLGAQFVYGAMQIRDGKFSITSKAKASELDKDKNYDVVVFLAHGNLNNSSQVYRAPISLTAEQKQALFPEEETPEPTKPESVTVNGSNFDFDKLATPDVGDDATGVQISFLKRTDTFENGQEYMTSQVADFVRVSGEENFKDGKFTAQLRTVKLQDGIDYDIVVSSEPGKVNGETYMARVPYTKWDKTVDIAWDGTNEKQPKAPEKNIIVSGKGFDQSKFPNPIKSDGTEGKPAGIYVAAFDPKTDLTKVTMENMYKYVVGQPNWLPENQFDEDGNFYTPLELPLGSDYKIAVWVAHGNITDKTLLADPILKADDEGPIFSIKWDGRNAKKDPIETGNVTIGNAAKIGETLTAKTSGDWTDAVSFSYQWLRDGKPIKGATKDHYKVTKADAGSKLSVKVTGHKDGFADKSETSEPSQVEDIDEEAPSADAGSDANGDDGKLPEKVKNYKVSGATLDWGVKESFRQYLSHLPVHNDGKITLQGGATQSKNNGIFHFPQGKGVLNKKGLGTVSFKGGVRFTGHDGEMDLKLSNLRMKFLSATKAQLILDAKVPASETMDTPAFNKKNVVYANLSFSKKQYTIAGSPVAGLAASGSKAISLSNAKAVLTKDGNKAMGGFYEAGETMDPASITGKVSATAEDPTDEGGNADGGSNGSDNGSNGSANGSGANASADGNGSAATNGGGTSKGQGDSDNAQPIKQCEPVASTKNGRTVTATAFKDGSGYKVELKGSGFINDKLPKPINDSGKAADGIYAAVVKKDANLSKITMDNMDSTTLGEAIWITKNSLGSKGTFTNSVRGIPADAGDEVRVITWVAHGNLGKDVITSDQAVKLDCAKAGGSNNTGEPNDDATTPGGTTPGSTTPGSVTPGQVAAAQQCRVVYVSDGSSQSASSSDSATTAQSAPQASAPSAGSGSATLNWGVKASFLSYIKGGIAKGNITTGGGAAQSGSGLTWGTGSGSLANGGTVSFPGSVHFTGHNGILDTTFSNLRIKSTGAGKASIILDSKSQDMDGKDASAANVDFATVSFSGDGSTGINNGTVTLTAAGAKAFAGFYSAGQGMDGLNLTVAGAAAGATGGSSNPLGLIKAMDQLALSLVPSAPATPATSGKETTTATSAAPVESGITVSAGANAADYQASAPKGMKATIVCGDKMASTGADNANLIGTGAVLALLGAAAVAFAARRKAATKN
jgi:hypothetical protein